MTWRLPFQRGCHTVSCGRLVWRCSTCSVWDRTSRSRTTCTFPPFTRWQIVFGVFARRTTSRRDTCPCGALRGRDSTQEVSAIGRRMSGHCGRKSPGARRRPRRCPRRRKDNRGHADSPSKGAVQSWCRWRRRSKRRLLVQSRTLSKTRKPTNAAAPANTHQNSKAFFNLAQPLRKRQSTQASQQFSLWPCHPPPGEGTRRPYLVHNENCCKLQPAPRLGA